MMMEDGRNLTDSFKGKTEAEIISQLDKNGVELEIAIENTLRDYNMGTIVRNANAFGVRHIHIIGRKQWNKRGAMATDKYLHVHYYPSVEEFAKAMTKKHMPMLAIDNNVASEPIERAILPSKCVMIFGQEGPGVSAELLAAASATYEITQRGSTRSMNVGVASGIAMYEWSRQHN
jgi:tRNA G18 (ribose-2'-O)-methylase SpoU